MRSMWSSASLSWFQLDLFPAPALFFIICINYSFEIVVLVRLCIYDSPYNLRRESKMLTSQRYTE
jgi:hypothetical protein